ncbi:hypothetical protein ACFL1X_06595 [Candidatus Hydrogenedentota bacterium]
MLTLRTFLSLVGLSISLAIASGETINQGNVGTVEQKADKEVRNPMPVGVDDAGRKKPHLGDPGASEAFEAIGFEFLSCHFDHSNDLERIAALTDWAEKTGHDFLINQEMSPRPKGDGTVYRRPGLFYQPAPEAVKAMKASEHCLGVCYDEAEHWSTNGVWVTGGGKVFAPHFHDAEGEDLFTAYESNLYNIEKLMETVYSGFAEAGLRREGMPVIGVEYVFPIMHHVYARAGMIPIPKYLKETVTPVQAAMALGASKQYGTQYWACLDLWHVGDYPGHTPEELRSALLFAYWTGADRAYIENLSYNDSLFRVTETGIELNEYGKTAQDFIRNYVPANPRNIHHQDFAPEIVIIRFPDSDWGQKSKKDWQTWLRDGLYGATNLKSDEDTRNWLKIWHVLTHGKLPPTSLGWNAGLDIPYSFFMPANNVAVYDHTAADPALYENARLVFLTGKKISLQCMRTIETLVEKCGLTAVTTSRLAPRFLKQLMDKPYTESKRGKGTWVVTDDVTCDEVVDLLKPYLGNSNEMRYVFADREVIFRESKANHTIAVVVNFTHKSKPQAGSSRF